VRAFHLSFLDSFFPPPRLFSPRTAGFDSFLSTPPFPIRTLIGFFYLTPMHLGPREIAACQVGSPPLVTAVSGEMFLSFRWIASSFSGGVILSAPRSLSRTMVSLPVSVCEGESWLLKSGPNLFSIDFNMLGFFLPKTTFFFFFYFFFRDFDPSSLFSGPSLFALFSFFPNQLIR